MTLGELLDLMNQNPGLIIFYFVAVPLSALLALFLAKGDGHISPWKYFYCGIIYLACVPGIFSITLTFYKFLFERTGINDMNIYTQILPIISMILTIYLIKRNVALDQIPGFGKLSGLLMVIITLLIIMWILDRTRIIVFTGFPFFLVILMMVIMFVIIRLGIKKIAN